jgi:superfamily II DNA/RNA helicase
MALQTFAQELTDSPLLLLTSESDYSKSHAEGLDMNKNPKLDMCLELIEQILEAEEKVCIFSKFERMQSILTEAINKKFNKKNNDIKIAYINGSLSSEQRYEEAYTKFRDTNDYKILLCSDAGAEGLNLSKCKYLIEYDLATSYAIQTQRQGRVERADSIHKQAFVFQLIGKNVWDEIQEKIIAKKEGFDSNIIKSLAKN